MTLAPEELELRKKEAVFERLKDRLASREAAMAELRTELEQFEARYSIEVGRLYATLDDIEASIAEEEFKLVPDDEEIKKKAEELRRLAAESAERAANAEANLTKHVPTAEARRAYHSLARSVHPDLALDMLEKERRHGLMAKLNLAYSTGDQSTLNEMLSEVKNSPDLIAGDGVAERLVRVIRRIAQVAARLRSLKTEKHEAINSELFHLREKVLREADEGRDVLGQMAARTTVQITKSERRLANLRAVNLAAERHVKDTYGMDISGFRPPSRESAESQNKP